MLIHNTIREKEAKNELVQTMIVAIAATTR